MHAGKAALRKQIREIPVEAPPRAEAVSMVLAHWAVWQAARTVCAYAAKADEPDVLSPWPADKQIALPRVSGGDLAAYWVCGKEDLQPGAFGISEPDSAMPSAGDAFDLILVPGVAFDRRGVRLGRGKGFYDRFLARTTGYRVGVCFENRILESIPREPHDVVMDALLTPSGIFLCGPKNIR